MEQLSPEWFAARCGKVTASRLGDLMATTRSGYGASRQNYMGELIAEALTGVPAERFQNAAMQAGVENEPRARAAYEFFREVDVEAVGFMPHPRIAQSGASPDGLVGSDGLLEIKAPMTATHIETLLTETVQSRYMYQMQWQMVCADRAWCDFVSFDPRMPALMQMFCKRIHRDNALIATLEQEVGKFLREMGEKILALGAKYEAKAA